HDKAVIAWSSARMPPPLPAAVVVVRPLTMVRATKVIFAPAAAPVVLKTRLALFPFTTIDGPAITTPSLIASSPVDRVIVPKTEKLTVSSPGLALASAIRSRSEPDPLSFRFVTVNVVGTVRSSNDWRHNLQ